MRISTLSFSLLALAVCVSAASFQPLLAASIGQVGSERRQVSVGMQSSVPSQCTSTCNPISNEVSLGCPVTACCTTTFETQYYNCLECVGMALDATNYATAQNDLNLLYTTCVDMGFVLPRLELPGQTNSSSSAGAPATSTGSVVPAASAADPFPTASSSVAPSGSGTTATGAAMSAKWRGVRVEALIGTAVLLGFVRLW